MAKRRRRYRRRRTARETGLVAYEKPNPTGGETALIILGVVAAGGLAYYLYTKVGSTGNTGTAANTTANQNNVNSNA